MNWCIVVGKLPAQVGRKTVPDSAYNTQQPLTSGYENNECCVCVFV